MMLRQDDDNDSIEPMESLVRVHCASRGGNRVNLANTETKRRLEDIVWANTEAGL